MDPIASLMDEHRMILAALARFEAWAHSADDTSGQELAEICDFLLHFVDPIHHIKEEDLLFAAMGEHGFPKNHEPIAVMLHEHEQGRLLVSSLAAVSRKTPPWTEQDLSAARASAQSYAALLNQHIYKEVQILYPMARARLPPAELERLGLRMEALDRSPERAAARERLMASAARWLAG